MMKEGSSQQGVAALGCAVIEAKSGGHEHGEVLQHDAYAVVHGDPGAASRLCDLCPCTHV